MRTLIILKGLSKFEKQNWVTSQGLDNYFLDINVIRKLYSSPELFTPHKEVLTKSFTDTVYRRFIEIVCSRLSKGCLVILDAENESVNVFETLAAVFGYTVFYVIQDIPHDYLRNPQKYTLPYYLPKRKTDLEKEINNFLNIQISDKLVIRSYKEVINYWNDVISRENIIKLPTKGTVLHVSDLHSNYSLLDKLPDRKQYELTVFHGDYIDGLEEGGSKSIIDFICKDKNKNTIWLEGNHELRLRKYLGSILFKCLEKKQIADILLQTVPDTFLETTALEFSDIKLAKAKEYLEILNAKLKMFCIIVTPETQYICTHAGIKYKEQIDPKFIGSVIYGSRDINMYDKNFSSIGKKKNYWSIHAHCKYPDKWEVNRYSNVINIDPHDENEVVFAERYINKWKVCQIIKENSN